MGEEEGKQGNHLYVACSWQDSRDAYCSGITFLSQFDLSASSAVMRRSGSNTSMLSSRSSDGIGMKTKSSRSLRRYCFFDLSVWNSGSLMTFGHTAGVGVPHNRDIISSWAGSWFA